MTSDDCKTCHFRILARQTREPHTPVGRLSPVTLFVFTLAPDLSLEKMHSSNSKLRLFCSLRKQHLPLASRLRNGMNTRVRDITQPKRVQVDSLLIPKLFLQSSLCLVDEIDVQCYHCSNLVSIKNKLVMRRCKALGTTLPVSPSRIWTPHPPPHITASLFNC